MGVEDYPAQLQQRAGVVIAALLEMGVSAHAATEAGQRYFQHLSAMVTGARNLKTFGYGIPPVVAIGEIEPSNLQTVVTRGKEEWGKIYLATSDPPVFKFENYSDDPKLHITGDFPVS
jgi:hypothetical protein